MNHKEIPDWPGYIIYSDGRVWSNKSNKFLKPQPNAKGYLRVCLSNGEKKQCLSIHKLVALAFIPNNDSEKTEVNHKDENILNNDVSNLEWIKPLDNLRYGTRIERISRARGQKVKQLTLSGELIAVYDSYAIAARETGLTRQAINNCALGKTKSSGGYLWQKVEDGE